MTESKIIVAYPAFTIVYPDSYYVSHGDSVKILVEGRWASFTFGSVAGYALQHFEDPIAAFTRAEERGHDTHWAGQDAVALTSHRQPHETFRGFELGDEVIFEGHVFRLDSAPNRNVKLTFTRPSALFDGHVSQRDADEPGVAPKSFHTERKLDRS